MVVLNLKIYIHFSFNCIYFLEGNSLGTNYVFVTLKKMKPRIYKSCFHEFKVLQNVFFT